MRTALILTSMVLAALPHTALAQAEDPDESQAYTHFTQAFSEFCGLDIGSAAADSSPPESWPLSWQPDYSDEPETATLYKFFCGAGAYNVNHMYYLESEFEGVGPIAFAAPHFDVTYENGDFDGAVEDIIVTGFETQLILTNSDFDPETGTIASHALWRGLGDAFSTGTWTFDQGQFVLKHFAVDAQYDGESDPKTLVDYQ